MRPVGARRERFCSTECRTTYPTRTSLEIELTWPRPEGPDRATSRLILVGDCSIRGGWNDLTGVRVLGVVVLVLGVGGGAGLLGTAIALSASAGESYAPGSGSGSVLGGLLAVMGAAVAGVGIGFGVFLLGQRDHAVIRIGPLRDGHLTLAPTEGGATLTLDARF